MTRSKDDSLQCSLCRKTFQSERGLLTHKCKIKERYLQRNDKAVGIGFKAYQRIYERHVPSKKPRSFDDFIRNPFYEKLVSFGRSVIDKRAIRPDRFIDFLLTSQTKVKDWDNQTSYNRYMREFIRTEDPLDAIERNFMLMKEWALENPPAEWQNFFREVAPTRAVLWIEMGRLSPWLLLTASTAPALTERFTDEQTRRMEQCIDGHFWSLKLKHHWQAVETIMRILKEHGI